MPDTDTKKPWISGVLIKMWEVFIEKLLVPVIMGAIALGFATCQQKSSQKLVDDVYRQVAEKLNKELPSQLDALRKQVNEQSEVLDQTRKAVIELSLRHAVEDELRRMRIGPGGSRTRAVGQPTPPASQPAEPAIKALKARAAPKPLAPLHHAQVPTKIKF